MDKQSVDYQQANRLTVQQLASSMQHLDRIKQGQQQQREREKSRVRISSKSTWLQDQSQRLNTNAAIKGKRFVFDEVFSWRIQQL